MPVSAQRRGGAIRCIAATNNQQNAIDELRVTLVTRWGTFYQPCQDLKSFPSGVQRQASTGSPPRRDPVPAPEPARIQPARTEEERLTRSSEHGTHLCAAGGEHHPLRGPHYDHQAHHYQHVEGHSEEARHRGPDVVRHQLRPAIGPRQLVHISWSTSDTPPAASRGRGRARRPPLDPL
eukprot:1193255-Prorocentrum_minimum.AAC.1